jgi:hypothetical protein
MAGGIVPLLLMMKERRPAFGPRWRTPLNWSLYLKEHPYFDREQKTL